MAILSSGQCLQPGQSLQSDSQLHTLIMQTDGNVVLYDRNSQPLWATDTGGLIVPGHFAMQTDGNLVLYDANGGAKWASNTQKNPGAFLRIQDDGNLVVYRSDAQAETAENALWAAGSNDWANQGQGGGQQGAPVGHNAFAEEILAAHNRYRAEVGMPPLQWSDSLAVDAQQWANYLASLGEGFHMIHSENTGQGENLWAGSSGGFSYTRMVEDWGSEQSSFAPGPFTGAGVDGGVVGHYTQMIWRDTTEVGCAIASGGGNDYLVCRYTPQGNVIGQNVP